MIAIAFRFAARALSQVRYLAKPKVTFTLNQNNTWQRVALFLEIWRVGAQEAS